MSGTTTITKAHMRRFPAADGPEALKFLTDLGPKRVISVTYDADRCEVWYWKETTLEVTEANRPPAP